MAVSYRLVGFLVALVVGGLVYALLGVAVDIVQPMAESSTETDSGNELYGWVSSIWVVAPVMMLIAAGAWLLKGSILGAQR